MNKMVKKMKKSLRYFVVGVTLLTGGVLVWLVLNYLSEREVLQKIIERLEADSRIAQVIVTDVHKDSSKNKMVTTIKFLEYDSEGKPLAPRYFTFYGNIIQFQTLVIRFDDFYVERGDKLRGRSVYLFWKVFSLSGKDTREYELTHIGEVPAGYKISDKGNPFERRLWRKFWEYALSSEDARRMGIKNAQIEAPGTKFIPGLIYTLKIEHDGGIRIDTSPLPEIIKGEYIPLYTD